ncbi:InlB B-repeat-containing protein, partial [Mesotoga sp. UBA5557]|uniref:InlB B-repeat-containing protein n=1 Tax=Mesotoga sp. UBA5557 TaxID=1946857 RepID=UPI0025D78705
LKTFEVVATAGENGTITPEGTQTVECGDDIQFTFTPDEGYGVDQVTVDGAPVDVIGSPDTTDKTYNLEDIRDNHAIDATFKQVFFVTEFDFQGQSPLGNRYDVHIEVDPEVTLLKFSYPGDDTELPVAEAAVVGGVANIDNFFTLDDADFLMIKAFTADGNLLAEIVVELDYSEAFLKVATFTPKKEWSLPSAIIYDVHIEVSDNVDKVEFAYPGNPEAEPIPAMAVPVGGVIDIEMNSVDFDAEEITVMAYSGAELLVSKNFDLLKVIEVTCEFVADYLILGISEFKFTVAVNSPFCAFIAFVADGDIQVEGNPFAVADLGAYEFRVFVDSALNRVDVMAKDGADDKIAERNIDLP